MHVPEKAAAAVAAIPVQAVEADVGGPPLEPGGTDWALLPVKIPGRMIPSTLPDASTVKRLTAEASAPCWTLLAFLRQAKPSACFCQNSAGLSRLSRYMASYFSLEVRPVRASY